MPGGQFSHFRDRMSLTQDTGHRGSIPGRSRPFRDGWQAYGNCSKHCTGPQGTARDLGNYRDKSSQYT